ncbi:MAG: NAD(P)/FAD-dependent oxidoreductase [Anaerolineae bacterium]|nr:NAD(P)/FAD-dependent oxidoreductase [Anaerolineae bacterium]
MNSPVIIIGAGLAGLAAGVYGQINGYQTRIFEQHTRPGGVCTAWKRKGYTIDGCIHWLMGAKPGQPFHRLYSEVGALERGRLIPIDHLSRAVDKASGQQIDWVADLDRMAEAMKTLSPQDGTVVDALIADVRALRGFPMDAGKPVDLFGPLDRLKQMWRYRRWLRLLGRYCMSMTEFARRFQHPFLRWALTHLFVSDMPALFGLILLAQLADGELALFEGGSLQFALNIANRYTSLGGEISYGIPVQEIIVESHCAVGVRLADGTIHRAGRVISAADGRSTLFDMLGGRYLSREIEDRYATWRLFSPILMISFGLDGVFPNQVQENMVRLTSPLEIGGMTVEGLLYRVFRDPALAPAGKTVVQAMIDADFDFWHGLHQDVPRYEAEKARAADQVLAQLEHHLPGIDSRVEMTDVATPHTFWRYTCNHRGAFEGWLMSADQMNRPFPKTLPGLDGFFMAGQWVEPGGGVPTVLCSGRQAIQLLCHREKRLFHTDQECAEKLRFATKNTEIHR